MAALLLAPLATTPSYRCVQQGDGSCATPTFEVESGEVHIGTSEGVLKAQSFRRKGSLEERWNSEEILGIKGLP